MFILANTYTRSLTHSHGAPAPHSFPSRDFVCLHLSSSRLSFPLTQNVQNVHWLFPSHFLPCPPLTYLTTMSRKNTSVPKRWPRDNFPEVPLLLPCVALVFELWGAAKLHTFPLNQTWHDSTISIEYILPRPWLIIDHRSWIASPDSSQLAKRYKKTHRQTPQSLHD